MNQWIRQGAPLVGEHNEQVLSGILGLSADDLQRLTTAGDHRHRAAAPDRLSGA